MPDVVTKLSTDDVLVSQWVEGDRIEPAADWPEVDRPKLAKALIKRIQMTASQQGDPYPLLVALGFDERLLAPLRHKLAAICTVLFEPFGQPAEFNLDRWNFRMAGPAHLLLILRAFRGLTFYLHRLKQDVSWHHTLRPDLTEHESALAAVK